MMTDRICIVKTVTSIVGLALVAACSGEQAVAPASATNTTECVQVEEGRYIFQNGKFIRANATPAQRVEPASVDQSQEQEGAQSWSETLQTSFSGLGYDWMGLTVRGPSAILTGTAGDAETKAAGFEAGQTAILATPEGADLNVIDGISVEGGKTGVGVALAQLDERPSLDACQKAFVDTMEGRNVQFRVGSATILPASARLLDAVSGVTAQCSAYNIEIEGHTDQIGDAALNLRLSQQRSDSVLAYLENRGVDASNIVSTGYGETRPIDTSGTRVGDALNRRTEFTVSER